MPMRVPERNIEELLNTLNKGEKKSFHIFLTRQKDKRKLLELLKLLNHNDLSYEKVKQKLKWSRYEYRKELNKLKEHLYQWLFFKSQNLVEIRKEYELILARILIGRKAYKEAYGLLKKLTVYFKKMEYHGNLFQVYSLQRDLIQRGKVSGNVGEITRKIQEPLLQMEIQSYFTRIGYLFLRYGFEIFDNLGNAPETIQKMKSIITSEDFQNKLNNAQGLSAVRGYNITVMFYMATMQLDKAEKDVLKMIEILTKLPYRERFESEYWSVLNNYILILMFQGNYNKVLEEIKKYQNKFFFQGPYKKMTEITLFTLEMEAYAMLNNTDKIKENISRILEQTKRQINFEHKSALLLVLAKYYYLTNDLQRAGKLLENVMKVAPKRYIKYSYARIGYLLVLFTLHRRDGDNSYYHYLTRNQIRWFHRHGIKFNSAKILIKSLDNLMRGKQLNIEEIQLRLRKIERENIFEKHFIRFFNLYELFENLEIPK